MERDIDSVSLQEEFLQTEKLEEEVIDSVAMEENPKIPHEFTWAEKHQPKALKSFICHREIAEKVIAGDISHLILEGLPGIGKRTMALALLRKIFGPDISKTREQVLSLDLKSVLKRGETSNIQIRAQVSPKHVEVNLSESDLKGHATEVALLLIKETHNASRKEPPSSQHNLVNAKAIVFHQAEKISKTAQTQIQSFLENSEGQYKVIFCSSDSCKLQILKHLCRVVNLRLPSDKEIVGVLKFIAKQEDIELPHKLAETIAKNSRNCLRQAIRSFEATWLAAYPFKEGQSIMTGWEDELAILAKSIIEEPGLKLLYLVRKKVINLMEHHVCQEFVISTLMAEMKKHVSDSQDQLDLESLYEEISWRNEVFCQELCYKDEELYKRMRELTPLSLSKIEEFVARFMSYYNTKRIQFI